MAILTNTAEGYTEGANVAVSTSGGLSGDSFNTIVINNLSAATGGTAITARAAAAIDSTMGYRIIPPAGNTYLRWDAAITASRFVMRIEFTYSSHPAGDTDILTMRNSSAPLASFTIHSTGHVSFRNNITYVPASRSATPMVTGKKYAAELAVTPHATTGEIAINVTDIATGVVHHTYVASNVSTGTGNATQYRFVNLTSASGWSTFDLDNLQAGDLASGWIGALTQPLETPVVTVTGTTDPSTFGATNGTITITWPAVANAGRYEAGIANGNVGDGFSTVSTNVTSPYTFTGLGAGIYTVAIKAKVS